MLSSSLRSLAITSIRNGSLRPLTTATETNQNDKELDKLFSNIKIEYRGHDPAVLQSYSTFLLNACHHLNIENTPVQKHPYVRWITCLNKSKFAHKKYKVHYETRTHIRDMSIKNVTGSTASTFLEYIQRNIPEGVAMKVDYTEICDFPMSVKKVMEQKTTAVDNS